MFVTLEKLDLRQGRGCHEVYLQSCEDSKLGPSRRGAFYGFTMFFFSFLFCPIHSSKILTIQQGLPRGVSSIGNPRGPLTGFNSHSHWEEYAHFKGPVFCHFYYTLRKNCSPHCMTIPHHFQSLASLPSSISVEMISQMLLFGPSILYNLHILMQERMNSQSIKYQPSSYRTIIVLVQFSTPNSF